MKIDNCGYDESLNIVTGERWVKIRAGATIEEGETFEQVLLSLKKRVNNFQDQILLNNNPEQGRYVSFPKDIQEATGMAQYYTTTPEIQQQENLTPDQKIINAINLCTDEASVLSFDLIVKNNEKKYPQIRQAYNLKLKELTK